MDFREKQLFFASNSLNRVKNGPFRGVAMLAA